MTCQDGHERTLDVLPHSRHPAILCTAVHESIRQRAIHATGTQRDNLGENFGETVMVHAMVELVLVDNVLYAVSSVCLCGHNISDLGQPKQLRSCDQACLECPGLNPSLPRAS